MWEEIQKRPFSRPLFLWIVGILIQTYLPGYKIGMACILFVFSILFLSFILSGKEKREVSFDHRWVWGIPFSLLFLSLAIGKTELAIRPTHAYGEKSPSKIEKLPYLIHSRHIQQVLLADFDQLRLTDEEKSVLATLTLGYRRAMHREVRKRFSVTGVSHLLAVSGFHVGIVCGFFTLLLWPLAARPGGRKLRYILALVFVWGYVWITGMAASAVRAGIMLSVYLIGRILGRLTDRYNTWAAAAFCMLAYDPLYLFDIGFQLSYLAVFFILFFQPRLQHLIPVRNPLIALPWQWLTVTLAAQAGTTFLCLYYFRQFSWVFVFTNLPLTGLATLLIPAGLLWIVLPTWLPGYGGLQYMVEMLTRAFIRIVDTFARLPGASYTGSWGMGSVWIAYGICVFCMLYVLERRPWQLLAAIGGVLIILIGQLIERWMLF